MKRVYRREKQQYLFAGVLAILAVVNLLFFVILYRPALSEYSRLQDSIQKLHAEVQARQQSVERLEKLSAQLETSDQDRQKLFSTHFIPRDTGFSEILRELERIAQRSGVKKSQVDYAIDDAPQYRLYSVKIRIPVTAGYPNIMDFLKDIESSKTFFIINSIDVRKATPDVALSLDLETFFYQ